MNPQISDYQANAEKFGAVVHGPGDWSGDSPCDGWTAADVLDHVVDSQRDFLEQRGAAVGERPTGAPPEVWRAHREAVGSVVTDEEFVTTEYDGYFGRTSVADTLANFHGFDMIVHRWDLGRALGQEVTFDDAELDRIEKALDGFGDALYSDGVCKPAIDVPDDAPRQARLLGRMGRRT